MTDHIGEATKKVTDLDALEKLADEAEACSPSPWQHTPSTRTVHRNESGYLADRDGNWIATFDGREENDFSAAANPATIKALIAELKEARALMSDLIDANYAPSSWSVGENLVREVYGTGKRSAALISARTFLARNGKGEG